jgi:hypothetical protein
MRNPFPWELLAFQMCFEDSSHCRHRGTALFRQDLGGREREPLWVPSNSNRKVSDRFSWLICAVTRKITVLEPRNPPLPWQKWVNAFSKHRAEFCASRLVSEAFEEEKLRTIHCSTSLLDTLTDIQIVTYCGDSDSVPHYVSVPVRVNAGYGSQWTNNTITDRMTVIWKELCCALSAPVLPQVLSGLWNVGHAKLYTCAIHGHFALLSTWNPLDDQFMWCDITS